MRWREFVKDYLSFSRKERIGILVIIFLMLLVYFFPSISTAFIKKGNQPDTDTSWMVQAKKLLKHSGDPADEDRRSHYNDEDYDYSIQRPADSYFTSSQGELFYFDPNTLSAEGWMRLGIREKTIKTIQNYVSKGGRFKKPEDLQKIYGLQKKDYERLLPFIRIEQVQFVKTEIDYPKQAISSGTGYPAKYAVIDINQADTTAFISLPGIGSKLASRIVNFREKLGGFYSIEQVGETYGVPDSTFQKIKPYLTCNDPELKKININTATVDELKAHPYIKYSLANPIVSYRNEHGPFTKLEDLKKVMVVTEDIFKRIAPYLSL